MVTGVFWNPKLKFDEQGFANLIKNGVIVTNLCLDTLLLPPQFLQNEYYFDVVNQTDF